MADPELVGYDDTTERKLYVLSVAEAEQVPESIVLSSPRFVCLISWHANGTSVDTIARVARKLLDSGAVYVCVWGSDCERVHDIVDEVSLGPEPPLVLERVVMTTWHTDEPLSEAIWFVLRCSSPDEGYEAGCNATLGLSIGSSESAAEMRRAFSDPTAFTAEVLESESCKECPTNHSSRSHVKRAPAE
jgi:hypothetical protein